MILVCFFVYQCKIALLATYVALLNPMYSPPAQRLKKFCICAVKREAYHCTGSKYSNTTSKHGL